MGKKKKQPKSNTPRANTSFQTVVNDAVNVRVKELVLQSVQQAALHLSQEIASNFEDVYSRLTALEDLVLEAQELDRSEYANLVADVQDASSGLEEVDTVESGDTVRVCIKTKTKDQDEFQGESNLRIDNVGTGSAVGTDIETNIIGMEKNTTKEINFGDKMIALVKVIRVSRAKGVKDVKDA